MARAHKGRNTSASRFTKAINQKLADRLPTARPEVLLNGKLGNALDIPGMGMRTPIWAIFPTQFSWSIS
jgi:hypothetical protein